MSVNPNPAHKPDWSYYNLAMQYEERLIKMGGLYKADDIESLRIGQDVAMTLCFNPDANKIDDIEKYFFQRCKYSFIKYKLRAEFAVSQTLTHDERYPNEFIETLARSQKPSQEDACFLNELFAEAAKLPKKHQQTFIRMLMGDNPIEIATRLGRPVDEIFSEMKVAREWVLSLSDSIGSGSGD